MSSANSSGRMVHEGAAAVVDWMVREGRHMTHMREFGDEMCRRISAAGIPIWRAFCSVATLHPQIAAAAYIWRRGKQGAVRLTASHDFLQAGEFASSPIAEVGRAGMMIRRRLCDPECPMDFPALAQFQKEGATDYAAMPMRCSSEEVNCITWSTDHDGGFTDAEIRGLASITEALALIVELQSSRRITRHLLDAYLGHRTGQRVLRGAITRGSEEAIRAVIWFADLRDFTGLADRLPRQKVIDLLNEYFEVMVDCVVAEGGEVLKFIGDAILAIFELSERGDPHEQCAAAIRAARAAVGKIRTRNRERETAGDPPIRFGLALHLGEVSYGNIGAPNRLDFTVIGPAVNHASRLEKLASEVRRPIVASASFAAMSRRTLQSLGRFSLKGVSEPQEIFALDDDLE